MTSIQGNVTGRGMPREIQPISVSVAKAAEILGCSKSFLDKLRGQGGGPEFYKFGSRCLYRLIGLEKFVAAQQRLANTAEYGGFNG